jgi:AcrR family transcriptional regulator
MRLDREAWVRAGLAALEEGGVDAVAAASLATKLGVTRGSFYWHFGSRDELLQAVLDLWEVEHSDGVLDALGAVADPRERLRLLSAAASGKPPSIFVRLLEAAGREPMVAATLSRSRARRVAFIARAYAECGLSRTAACRRALAAYATYVGLAHLIDSDADLLPGRERPGFSRELAAMLVPPAGTPT